MAAEVIVISVCDLDPDKVTGLQILAIQHMNETVNFRCIGMAAGDGAFFINSVHEHLLHTAYFCL